MEDLHMKLSTLYTAVPEYIEFAWLTAPNAAAQAISANTITTLTLDTEVADTGGLVSAPSSNQFTLPAGTYYYEAQTHYKLSSNNLESGILALYNVTDSTYVSCSNNFAGGERGSNIQNNGQLVIAAAKTFELRLAVANSSNIISTDETAFTLSTAGTDQRTTIKLWKLK
jgi:hypothetical protein